MKQDHSHVDDTLPIQLKIRVLRAELEQIEADLDRLHLLREEISGEIREYQDLLDKRLRYGLLHRIK